jgi:cellulose synthase/poly-beta-1,6-N-acetylglucosamine synthase-like glycosyltransferase
MVKVSFAITVCNEINEIKGLLPFLINNVRHSDEIVILFDEKNGNIEVLNYLLEYEKFSNVRVIKSLDFNNNFADWKNKLNEYCTGTFIISIDADEMIDPNFIEMLPLLFELNPEVDLYYLPRINTVSGIGLSHIDKWGWKITKNKNFITDKEFDLDNPNDLDEYNLLIKYGLIIEEKKL